MACCMGSSDGDVDNKPHTLSSAKCSQHSIPVTPLCSLYAQKSNTGERFPIPNSVQKGSTEMGTPRRRHPGARTKAPSPRENTLQRRFSEDVAPKLTASALRQCGDRSHSHPSPKSCPCLPSGALMCTRGVVILLRAISPRRAECS